MESLNTAAENKDSTCAISSVGQRSLIWSVFDHLDNENGSDEASSSKYTARCMLCSVKVKHCGGTRNLWQHIERHHKEKYLELQDSDTARKSKKRSRKTCKASVPIIASEVSEVIVSSFIQKRLQPADKKRIDNALCYFIVKDIQPFSIINDEGFLRYSQTLNRDYTVPSRQTLNQMIDVRYDEVSTHVMDKLQHLSYVSITTDLWTSTILETYITIMAHGISKDFQPVNVVLATHHMLEQHNGDNIADTVESAIKTWKLEGKVFAVVTDNTSSMKKAVEKLIQKGLCMVHYNCFGHALQLCVEDGLQSQQAIIDVIHKFRDIVSAFHHSTILTESLKKAQETLGMPVKKLIGDTKTRWYSSCLLLRSVIELQQPISLCLYNSKATKKSAPSEYDYDLARKLVDTLEIFEEASTIASVEQNVTVSVVHPMVEHLINSIDTSCGKFCSESRESEMRVDDEGEGCSDNSKSRNTKIISSFKEELKKSLLHRFQDILFNNSYRLSTFLDPRFKSTYGEVSDITEFATQEIMKLQTLSLPLAMLTSQKITPVVPDQLCIKDTNLPRPRHKRSFWERVEDTNVVAVKVGLPSMSDYYGEISLRCSTELAFYKREEPLETGSDVFTYWHERQEILPLLNRLAQKFLCSPATSVPSERIFSTAGQIIAARWSCLEPAKADKLIFLNKNWKMGETG
uniref:Zinc finger BED domain-containing protein 4-like n=1 Tax=Geotrypetes seraphini TaxID=260995 RepID=A0A6P8Q4C9_GEOSA|nr:zinc finger BED domain-containing protein 4-like [Geotrypetes seraphini]